MLTPPPAVSAELQFSPQGGKLFIDRIIDPSGKPLDVFDKTVGFTVEGHLELPGWLSGKGVVRLVADQIGGQFDGEIGRADLAIPGSTTQTDPLVMTYPWSIKVMPPALPESEMYQLGVIFIFKTVAGGHTDIGAFYDLGAFLLV